MLVQIYMQKETNKLPQWTRHNRCSEVAFGQLIMLFNWIILRKTDRAVALCINRLNNRKARLARAAKDNRAQPEVDDSLPDKQAEQGQALQPDSPESPGNEVPSTSKVITWGASRNSAEKSGAALSESVNPSPAELALEPGQHVAFMDARGEEIGEGTVHQVYGKWNGSILEESKTCVVNITELKVQKWSQLPYPSETTGSSFEEAEAKIGTMRVLWDLNKISQVRP